MSVRHKQWKVTTTPHNEKIAENGTEGQKARSGTEEERLVLLVAVC